MALILKNNNYYLKLEIDGTYYIYASNKARDIEKKVTPPAIISAKY